MKVFVIAGEASGDRLGAALIDGLRQLRPEFAFAGIGGAQMAARGLVSQFDMSELSLMGLAEILPKYRALKRRIAQTAAKVLELRPDVLLTIDSPDFCLRVARRVRAANPGIRTVHYVAPSVWAWRPGRARRMAGLIDQVLALLPFEPPYMEAHGIACDFVGHPVAAEPVASAAEVAAVRAEYRLGDQVLCVLPGSRRGEVRRLAPIFGEVLRRFAPAHPGLQVLLPAAPGLDGVLRELTAGWPIRPVIVDPHSRHSKSAMFQACRAALAASGTVSLELAAATTPMVIAYDMNWLSRLIISRLLLTDTVTLVNLVSETRAVPEFIGKHCRPDLIAPRLHALWDVPGEQAQAMAETMRRLGQGGDAPGLRAARAILDRL